MLYFQILIDAITQARLMLCRNMVILESAFQILIGAISQSGTVICWEEENMNNTGYSELLNTIGLGNIDIGYFFIGLAVLLVILLILVICLIVKTQKLKRRLDKFVLGKDGVSLEQDIIALFEDNKFLKINTDKNKADIRTLYKRMETAYQKMGLVKYDAFQQMGGKLSFSLALLNENNDGFIINYVHSTDGCYSYTKEIISGECSITLGKEEQKALSIAMGEDKK